MDVIEKYQKKAEEFVDKSTPFTTVSNIPSPHIVQIVASVMMTRDEVGYPGGSFVQAVVNNDLVGAISKADTECAKHLRLIVSAKEFARV